MFEIYTKTIEVEAMSGKQSIKVRPLNGRHFPKLLNIVKKFQNVGQESSKFFEALDEETAKDLHLIILETLCKSYPDIPRDQMDEFVTQNLFALMGPIFEVNINTNVKE